MIRKKIHARCTSCPLIFMTKVLQALPALGDYHLWMTWEWLTSPLSSKQAAVKLLNLSSQRQHSLQNDLDGKILESSLEMGTKVRALWFMDDGNICMETYQICTFIRPQILTLTLLWQAISFQCTVLKRSRSDTLLDKDSAIATISSAWENRRTGIAVCLFLHVVSSITGRIFKKYQGKKDATAHGPETSRSIPTAQNMHNLLPFSEEHPQSKALPWSRANNENHSRINCCQPHICRSDGSSPLCLNYVQIWTHPISDWIWLGF